MSPQPYETMFYELMWRIWSQNAPYPMPWWLQSYFRDWPGDDGGMFGAKETALASNALYRYWNMVGVKDAHQESLVGQAGEIEPVYERYAVTFFVVADGRLHFPQYAENGAPGPNPGTAAAGRLPARRRHDLPAAARNHRRAAHAEHGGGCAEPRRRPQPPRRARIRDRRHRPASWESPSSRSSRAASSGTARRARLCRRRSCPSCDT